MRTAATDGDASVVSGPGRAPAMIAGRHRLDDSGVLTQQRPRLRFVAVPASEMKTLKWRRELQHRSQCFLLIELSRGLQRRAAITNRPEVDMIAARRLLAVVTLPGPQVEQFGIALKHRAHNVAESERPREKDVRRCPTLDEIARQVESARVTLVVEHPLCRRRAMVQVSRVNVSAGLSAIS